MNKHSTKDHQVVLITGSSSGIGRFTAETLARRGHHVYATMRDPQGKNAGSRDELENLAAREGIVLKVVELDVTDDASAQTAVAHVIHNSGRIDVLLNNAGTFYAGLTEPFTVDQAKEQFETNFFGALRMNRAVLPHMRERRNGLLIHVSSLAGRVVFPFFGLYGASKFALEGIAESYRYELSGLGIDSVIVEPGPFPTPIMGKAPQPADPARMTAYGDVAQIPASLFSTFESFLSSADAPSPQVVADAIAELVDTPAGQRPLRTVAGLDYGVIGLNESVAPTQQGLLEALGLTHLAQINTPTA